jgi:hypothetical protein
MNEARDRNRSRAFFYLTAMPGETARGVARHAVAVLSGRQELLSLGFLGYIVRTLLALDALVNLFAVYGHGLRRVDADTYLIALHPQNRDGDFITNHDGLSNPSRENEHLPVPLLF